MPIFAPQLFRLWRKLIGEFKLITKKILFESIVRDNLNQFFLATAINHIQNIIKNILKDKEIDLTEDEAYATLNALLWPIYNEDELCLLVVFIGESAYEWKNEWLRATQMQVYGKVKGLLRKYYE